MGHQLVLVLISDPDDRVLEQVAALIKPHSIYAKARSLRKSPESGLKQGRFWEEDEAFDRGQGQEDGEKSGRDDFDPSGWLEAINPEGHYDWCEIGGRWDGIFDEAFAVDNDETDALGGKIKGNICPVDRLPGDFYPGSFVTPDGEWHFFGWRFGGEDPNPDDVELIRSFVERYRGLYAVAVDVHA